MKRISLLTVSLSLVAFCCLFTNCQKGDAGPAGPAGAAGAAGAAGQQGPKGDTGTANVIYSAWMDVAFKPDTVMTGDIIDTIGFYANITATQLSSTIISGGEMKVELNLGTSASPDVVPLPYLDYYSGLNISVDFFIQKISLYANANVSTLTQSGAKYLQYRYILIPGGVAAQSVHGIDWSNYAKVRSSLGLTN